MLHFRRLVCCFCLQALLFVLIVLAISLVSFFFSLAFWANPAPSLSISPLWPCCVATTVHRTHPNIFSFSSLLSSLFLSLLFSSLANQILKKKKRYTRPRQFLLEELVLTHAPGLKKLKDKVSAVCMFCLFVYRSVCCLVAPLVVCVFGWFFACVLACLSAHMLLFAHFFFFHQSLKSSRK